MKKILLTLALILMIATSACAVDGTYTTYGNFYLIPYGGFGIAEWTEYNAYMQIADTQIEANRVTISEEGVQDVAGGMFTGNTETFLTLTYQDADGTIDGIVPVKDEDDMASDSAVHLATQQSIKAYVLAEAGGATTYLELTDTPGAYDTGKYAKSTAAGVVWDDPTGSGDMLKAVYDTDNDSDVDVASGGTEKGSWTQYAIPYLSNTTVFSEIPIGTAEYALTVAAGAAGYDWTLFDLSLYYLKTAIDTQAEVEAIWSVALVNDGDLDDYYLKTAIDTLVEVEAIYSKDLTDSDELASALTNYYLKTAIDTIGEVESIWSKDITDSDELAAALADYYLKTAIDTQGEVETIWGVTLATDAEITALCLIDLDDTPAGYESGKYLRSTADGTIWDSALGVDTYGTPADNDFARFTDTNTIEGRDYAEMASDLDLFNFPIKWSGLTGFCAWHSYVAEYGDMWLANGFDEWRTLRNYLDTSGVNASKAAVIAGNVKGLKAIWGVSSVGTTITSSNWAAFEAAILAAAQWAQDNGVFEFQIGNEEELHNDDDTMTDAELIAELKDTATAVQAIYTIGNVSYSTSWNHNALIAAGRGDIDLIGSNIYRTADETSWEALIYNALDAFGVDNFYMSEFNVADDYSEDEAVEAVALSGMLDYIISLGITRALFYCWKDDDFGVLKADGTYKQVWNSLVGSELNNNDTALGIQTQDIVFEGSTKDAYETTFVITDPTQDNDITFPDSDQTVGVATSGNTTTFTATDNESEALACPIVFVDGATGAQGAETDDTDFTYNPSTGTLKVTALDLTTVLPDAEVANNITIDLATLATTFTATDNESEDLDCAVLFADGYTGTQGVETDGDFHYSPDTGTLTATVFAGALTGNASGSSGSCTGLAATATALATARMIGGVNFDGTAAITPIYLSLDHALGSDEDYVGITDTVTVGYTTAIGDLMYFDWTATEWLEAKADAVGTTPALRIALEVKNDGQTCLTLVQGYIRDDDAFDFGAARIYLNDDTAGLCDDTAPAESGDQIQLVGIGVSADILYFCPSIDVGEI